MLLLKFSEEASHVFPTRGGAAHMLRVLPFKAICSPFFCVACRGCTFEGAWWLLDDTGAFKDCVKLRGGLSVQSLFS